MSDSESKIEPNELMIELKIEQLDDRLSDIEESLADQTSEELTVLDRAALKGVKAEIEVLSEWLETNR